MHRAIRDLPRNGILVFKRNGVAFSTPGLVLQALPLQRLVSVATACELAGPEAEAWVKVELGDAEAREVEFVLRSTVVDGEPLVVATVQQPSHASSTACFDALTGLAARATLVDRLTKALADPARPMSLLMIDLDDFKLVNDRAGHAAGDRVLSLAAQRLSGAVRAEDLVARLGGDEFVVLCDLRSEAEAHGMAARVVAALHRPYVVGTQQFVLGCSAGVAFAPRDGTTPEALLEHADLAMYAAKEGGKNRFTSWAQLESSAERSLPRPGRASRGQPQLAVLPLVGRPNIDRAHRRLLALSAAAVEATMVPGGSLRGEWRGPLEQLLAEAYEHFEEEEGFIQVRPGVDEHRLEHQAFLRRVEFCLAGRALSGTAAIALADALVDHIGTDVRSFDALSSQRAFEARKG